MVAPVCVEYVPAGHCVHTVLPSREKVAAGHMLQFVLAVDVEMRPAGHGVDALADDARTAVENVPALHAVHDVEVSPSRE